MQEMNNTDSCHLALCEILSYSISQVKRTVIFMHSKFTVYTAVLITAFLLIEGCSKQSPEQPQRKSFVATYAELLLLHEKEKMQNHLPDSLYQMKVDTFFLQHHSTREKFRKTLADISANSEDWKNFLQEVNRAVDSLRNRNQ